MLLKDLKRKSIRMKLFGSGVDIVDVKRVNKLINKGPRYKKEFFQKKRFYFVKKRKIALITLQNALLQKRLFQNLWAQEYRKVLNLMKSRFLITNMASRKLEF